MWDTWEDMENDCDKELSTISNTGEDIFDDDDEYWDVCDDYD